MGQVPFHPPERQRMGGRRRLDVHLVHPRALRRRLGRDQGHDQGRLDLGRRRRPLQAIASARAATGFPRIGARTANALRRYAVQSVAGKTEDYEVEHYYPERQRVLRHLLLAGPDAHVC